MKLRIQGNLVRLRLTQKEVARLQEQGLVEASIEFPMGRKLTYSVASSSTAAEVGAEYEGDAIRVVLPLAAASAWAESNQVEIEGPQVLVEKDFQCLHKPGNEDPDGYPNPLAIGK